MNKLLRRFIFFQVFFAFLCGISMIAIVMASPTQNEAAEGIGNEMIGAALAIGLTGLGAGIGMGTASAAAIGALAERPEVFSKTLIFIVFIEAIAIYGLVISFMILMRI
mgnify:CR=1 FL=1